MVGSDPPPVSQTATAVNVSNDDVGVKGETEQRTYDAIVLTLGASGRNDALLALIDEVLAQLETTAVQQITLTRSDAADTVLVLAMVLYYRAEETPA